MLAEWNVSWRRQATSFEDVMATCHPPRIAEEVDCPRDCCHLKLVNMTWEGSLASTLGAYVLLRRQIGVRGSRETSSHILERIPILGRTRLWLDEPLEKVHTSIALALVGQVSRLLRRWFSLSCFRIIRRTRLPFEKPLTILSTLLRQGVT